jgi:hypothetical protein
MVEEEKYWGEKDCDRRHTNTNTNTSTTTTNNNNSFFQELITQGELQTL